MPTIYQDCTQRPKAPLAPEVFWIYYPGTLLYWLYDSIIDSTLATENS